MTNFVTSCLGALSCASTVCALSVVACGESASDSGATGGMSGAGATGAGGMKGGGGSGSGGVDVGGALGDGGCTGVPVPCADAGPSCEKNPGCHPEQLCVANGCALFVDGSCEGQPGCTWDSDAGTCVPPSCDTFDAGSCPTDAGCHVSSGCEGDAVPCEKLESCEYPGCLYKL